MASNSEDLRCFTTEELKRLPAEELSRRIEIVEQILRRCMPLARWVRACVGLKGHRARLVRELERRGRLPLPTDV